MKIFFPKVKYYTINDNFKLIFIKTESNIFSACITIDVGSINEHGTELGLAHFFEHMIFKGTTSVSSKDLLNKLDYLGTQYNASTSYDETDYYISGNQKDSEIILHILLDLFLNPAFPNEDIKNEINVVLEEFRMNEDNKGRQTFTKLMESLYKGIDDKYSMPVIGKPEYIVNLTRDNLLNFYKEHYMSGNKILSIIGSADEKKIIEIVEKMCKTKIKVWKPDFIEQDKELKIEYYNKEQSWKLNLIKTPDIKQFIVLFGFRSVNLHSRWNLVSSILENILTGGMTSRLFELLRNKLGLTYYQSSSGYTFNKHGFFYVNYGVQPDGLEISIDAVLKELFNFKHNGPTEDEMQKSKNMLETSILFNTQTVTDIGNRIINSVINKQDPKIIKKIHNRIANITDKHVIQLASKIFKKSNLFVVINGTDIVDYDRINNLIDIV